MIKLGSQLQEAAEQLEREKGIPRAVFIDSVKEAMMAAYKRYAHIHELEDPTLYEVRLTEKTGDQRMMSIFSFFNSFTMA